MKIVSVNKNLCIKCGACVAIAGNYFDFDEDGFAKPINGLVEENVEIKTAAEACPTQAITFSEKNK